MWRKNENREANVETRVIIVAWMRVVEVEIKDSSSNQDRYIW